MILGQFVHPGSQTLPALGGRRQPSQLHDEQRDAQVLLHRYRKFLEVLLRGTLPVEQLAFL
jgi:hypothetical protein